MTLGKKIAVRAGSNLWRSPTSDPPGNEGDAWQSPRRCELSTIPVGMSKSLMSRAQRVPSCCQRPNRGGAACCRCGSLGPPLPWIVRRWGGSRLLSGEKTSNIRLGGDPKSGAHPPGRPSSRNRSSGCCRGPSGENSFERNLAGNAFRGRYSKTRPNLSFRSWGPGVL